MYAEFSIIHPDFNKPNRLDNNIAILNCNGSFPSVIRIPITSLIPSVNIDSSIKMIGVGYGVNSVGGRDISRIPYYAVASVEKDYLCQKMFYGWHIPSTNLCGYTHRITRGQFCEGDRGNGLISDNKMWEELNTTTLVNIVTNIYILYSNYMFHAAYLKLV